MSTKAISPEFQSALEALHTRFPGHLFTVIKVKWLSDSPQGPGWDLEEFGDIEPQETVRILASVIQHMIMEIPPDDEKVGP